MLTCHYPWTVLLWSMLGWFTSASSCNTDAASKGTLTLLCSVHFSVCELMQGKSSRIHTYITSFQVLSKNSFTMLLLFLWSLLCAWCQSMYQQYTHISQCTRLLISLICSIYMYSCYSWRASWKNYGNVDPWCLEHNWHHFNQAGELCGVCACVHVCSVQSLLLHIHTYLLCVTVILLLVYNSICNW